LSGIYFSEMGRINARYSTHSTAPPLDSNPRSSAPKASTVPSLPRGRFYGTFLAELFGQDFKKANYNFVKTGFQNRTYDQFILFNIYL
jgi:hypothetical protein